MGSSIVHAYSGIWGPHPLEKEDKLMHDVDGADVIDDTTKSAVGVIVHFSRVEKCEKMFIAIDDRRE